jgi:toxin ParE1/3/4
MTIFKITPRAKESLKEIGRYTLKKWGKTQRNDYLRAIDSRFEWLANNPDMGRHRNDIEEGYYSYRHREHLIFYVIMSDHISVIGIPHTAMDILNYFN